MRRPVPSSGVLLAVLAGLWMVPGEGHAQAGLGRGEIDRISRTVVRIVAMDGGEALSTGSGTIVRPDGLIYTNRHVVEDGTDYQIELLEDPNERPVPRYLARLVGYSRDIDFALLQIDRNVDGSPIGSTALNLPSLPISDPDVQRGDRIHVFGYPGIGEGYLAFTEGAVTTIRNGTMNSRRMPVWYQTDAQISPGNSGGLAVNSRGQIVGLPTAVLSEDRTGGRLGGILADDGRLDYSRSPYFGTLSLQAGFLPDPDTSQIVSGGSVSASYLGGGCVGFAAMAPDIRLNWSGSTRELRIFFQADEREDATLLVNLPDGSWRCNDDARSGTLDPMVVLPNAPSGQYDIWVGSYRRGEYISGTLSITELDRSP